MSSLPGDVDDAGSVMPDARTPTAVVDGDVVFPGVVLLFVALALAFVLYHYVTVYHRGVRDAAAGTASRGDDGRRHGVGAAAAAAASGFQGVDPAVLRALPVTWYRAKYLAEALECAVCLAELSDGEAARFLPRCGHGFHAECVDLWLRSHPTCPLCRVDVDKPEPSSTLRAPALPPVLPEPANYPTNLPTNVLFWGSQDAVTTARTVGGRPSSSATGAPVLVIEIPESTTPARVAPPREGDADAAKSRGLARLRSLGRLWSRGRHEAGAGSTPSCRRASATASGAHAGVAVGNLES